MSTSTPKAGERLLRLPQVLDRVPVSRAHWWAGIKQGRFPRGLKLTERCTCWRESDIDALIASLSPDDSEC